MEIVGFLWNIAALIGHYRLLNVHGAGAQRSDPKSGNPAAHPLLDTPLIRRCPVFMGVTHAARGDTRTNEKEECGTDSPDGIPMICPRNRPGIALVGSS